MHWIKTIAIPESVSLLQQGSFYGCNNLDSINIDTANPTYESIDGVVLSKNGTILFICPPGKSGAYSIPDSVTTINGHAFYGCNKLTSVNITEGVETINSMAFSECSSLTNVTLPSTVKSVSGGPFCLCSNLEAIFVDSNNSKFTSDDGVLYSKGKTSLIQFPNGKSGDNYTIPDRVTGFAISSFRGCHKLTNITITSHITSIASFAFMDTGLKNVTISSSVTSIGNGPFADCTNLTSINVDFDNNNFSSIDGVLFDKNGTTLIQFPAGKIVDHYSVPDSVETVGYLSFGKSNIKSLTLLNNIKTIETRAFDGCKNMKSLSYLGTSAPSYGQNPFLNCDSLEFICTPENYLDHSFCGRTSVAYSEECTELEMKENKCNEVVPKNGTWVVQHKGEAFLWEEQTDECVEYKCENGTGNVAKNKCDQDSAYVCMNGECVKNDTIYERNTYVLIIEIDASENIYIDTNVSGETICTKPNVAVRKLLLSTGMTEPLQSSW